MGSDSPSNDDEPTLEGKLLAPTETARERPSLVSGFIGPYKVLETLGEGGMGTVYLAEQTEPIRRRVALKVIKLGMDTKQVVARFEAERQALALMNHPNVAKVFDAGTTPDGRPFFVMEYVAGIPITDYCDMHRLNTNERLELFSIVCHAVQHAHQKGIIHRDIKPSNVLVAVEGGKPVPRVIDFGVAKATEQRLTERTVFTEQGQLIGTPEYMSPEQAEMTALDVDTRTDIYSLGVMLYQLLAGALPFDSAELRRAGFAEIQRVIREQEPPKPSTRLSTLDETSTTVARRRHTDAKTLARQLQGDLDWITMKAMDKDRTRRYATPSEFADDIYRHLKHIPVIAGPPTAAYRLNKFVRRNRRVVTAIGVVFLALAAGLVSTTLQYLNAEQARVAEQLQRRIADRAEQEQYRARQAADYSRAEAIQVRDFLVHTIRSADPSKTPGREVTVKEMFDAAVSRINGAFPRRPQVEADLRLAFGNAYRSLGYYHAAESQLRRVVEIVRREFGEERDQLTMALTNLAVVLHDLRNFDEAIPLYREVYDVRRELNGEEHALTVDSRERLAMALAYKGNYAEAELIFQETLAQRRKALGDEHEQIADTLSNIGSAHRELGRYAEAERYLRDALQMRLKLLGPVHPWVAEGMNNLAQVLTDVRRYEEAELLLRGAILLWRGALGKEHRNVGRAQANLAELLLRQGKVAEAEPLIRQAMEIERRSVGEDNAEMGYYLAILAGVQAALGDIPSGEQTFRKSLSVLRKEMPRNHWMIDYVQSLLGRCLAAGGRFAEAETILIEAFESLRAKRRPDDPYVVETAQQVVDFYTKWGKPSRADEYRGLLQSNDAP